MVRSVSGESRRHRQRSAKSQQSSKANQTTIEGGLKNDKDKGANPSTTGGGGGGVATAPKSPNATNIGLF